MLTMPLHCLTQDTPAPVASTATSNQCSWSLRRGRGRWQLGSGVVGFCSARPNVQHMFTGATAEEAGTATEVAGVDGRRGHSQ